VSVDRRGFIKTGTVLAASVAAAPLLNACRLESRQDLADDAFTALRDEYFRGQLSLNPVTCTYLGGDGYDPALAEMSGRFRDYSTTALSAESAEIRRLERAHASSDSALLSSSRRIDHQVMGAQLAFLRFQMDRRYHERAVDTYVTEPFRGIDWLMQQMRPMADGLLGDAGEWAMLVKRLDAIPAYLAVARSNLDTGKRTGNLPDRRMVQRDGIAGSRANAAFFRSSLPAQAKAYLGGQRFAGTTLTEVAASGEVAANAFERFASWLENNLIFPSTDTADRYSLGEDAYEWRVRTVLRDDRPAADLYKYGEEQVELYTSRIAEVAERIASEKGIKLPFDTDQDRAWSIRRVIEDLSNESPASDEELMRWYKEAAQRAVAYGRERDMFDVPADYQLDIVPTPPVLRSTVDATYFPAPPFKKSGVGRFYLTPTGNDPAALRENNRASIATTAIHEGFPGHDWHFKYMSAHAAEISNVRWYTAGAVEDSSAMWADSMTTEGWGLYSEELMAEPSPERPYGFYNAGEYLYMLQGQLLRAVRVRVDVGLHTGRMTFDEAVDYFVAHVSFYPNARTRADREPAARAVTDSAMRAIYRYSKWPTQAITYNLGKNAIISMRDAYRLRRGSAYSAREFHERFMRMGTVPPGFFREALVG
jgi:uncharacterized protein (DUF885 family)